MVWHGLGEVLQPGEASSWSIPGVFGPVKVSMAVTLCCSFLAQRARIALPLLPWVQELCWICMVSAHHVDVVSLGCLGFLLSQFNFLQASEQCIILCFPSPAT